jgi:hypothetical protein
MDQNIHFYLASHLVFCICHFRIVFTALETPQKSFLFGFDICKLIHVSKTFHFPSPILDPRGKIFLVSDFSFWFVIPLQVCYI